MPLRFTERARLRPTELVNPTQPATLAPYVAAETSVSDGEAAVAWRSGRDRLAAVLFGGRVRLEVSAGGRDTVHRSRRHGRVAAPPERLAVTLTGRHLTAFVDEDGRWLARARLDLDARVDTRDEAWLAGLGAEASGKVRAGGFGQLGLRDPRVVSHPDGTPYQLGDGRLLLTATSAGPGFFDTAHASVWALDPERPALEHRADLFFRRPDRPGVYGDHAIHLVRDDDGWLVATSTWGDFDAARPGAGVGVTLARVGPDTDLTTGRHLLDTAPLALPTTGLRSVGVWDPHLVRTDDGWLVGYVNATRYFRFHPVLASGPDLERLELRGAAEDRRATEGTTLARLDGRWRVLASDGRDNRRPHRARYPVFDLAMTEVGELDAPYPSNLPWPTVAERDGVRLLVGFDGEPTGGALLGYGTHGDLVIAAEE